MLLLKRLLTAAVLFFILAILLFVLTSTVLGGIVGARAAVEQHVTGAAAYQVGQEAGQEMGRKYGLLIILCSVGVSALVSGAVTFGGVLPWCRSRVAPPPLPPGLI